ncbi:uncharacterized protein LOC128739767 [Sabethes cyaneus]|uniref:uncharacterized protein LOC128739767 n=1 Tax=Sabethes cyaneus TaxID=53552 RepID=UPI00237DEE13|nr:uncharacterized protein LOC128739767 [Sabethes cyaneus]
MDPANKEGTATQHLSKKERIESAHSDPVAVSDSKRQTRRNFQKEQLLVPQVEGVPAIELEKAQSEISCTSSKRSARARAKLQLQKLQEEQDFEKQQAERRRVAEQQEAEKHKQFLNKKYRILEELASTKGSSRCSNGSFSKSRVEDWVSAGHAQINPAQEMQPEQSQIQREPVQQQNRIRFQPGKPRQREEMRTPLPPLNSEIGCRSTEECSRCFNPTIQPQSTQIQPNRAQMPPMNSTALGNRPSNTVGHVNSTMDEDALLHHLSITDEQREEQDPFQLSRSQIAARQAVSRDLPTFSGNPEDWPIFLSMLNSTTAMCGFTEEENIVRLQKSLKGKAYEAVKCRLMHPGNFNGIVDTLKMLYGQPEIIVHSLIEKISCLPAVREEKLETLVDFAVNVQNFCATVESCGLEEYMFNVSLLHQLVGKLSSNIRLSWAQYRRTQSKVNLATFSAWLYSLAEAASSVTFPYQATPTRTEVRKTTKKETYLNAHSEANSEYDTDRSDSLKLPEATFSANERCPVCKGICKSVATCERFQELSRDSKWAVVREFVLCRTCLRKHKGSCKAKPCGKDGCSFRHHELLHNDATEQLKGTAAKTEHEQSPQPSTSKSGCNTHQTTASSVLFRYLPVVLYGDKRAVHTYAFLDDGSALTLLDQELANELQLDGTVSPLCLRWTAGTERHEAESRICNLQIAGVTDKDRKFLMNGVRTVKELLLPQQTLNMVELSQLYPHLRGLPIDSYSNARPRILIGMKHAKLSLGLKNREGESGHPIAIKTRLGWTVCGGWGSETNTSLHHYTFHICPCDTKTDDELHQAMKEYFALDSLGVAKSEKPLLSVEDERALSMLQALTRYKRGRYETGLLWRYDDTRLPDSRAMALRRFQCLKKRMEKDPEMARTLQAKISDYVEKGYIRKLTTEEVNQKTQRRWYLPIFPVTNPNKPGKVRIVWDAAAIAYGTSLNSALLKGPDLLRSLLAILLQFRERRIGLSGDIREMFHQVLIRPEDQPCQCFFWMNENGEMAVYVMRVMTFGACCSPSTAQFVKNTNAESFADKYPAACEAIIKSHYVDDMLVSVDTEEQAIVLAKDVRYVHEQGGFEIRNWVSNSKKVLTALQEIDTEEKCLDLSPELVTEKVLGMWWNTTDDVLTYKVGWNRYDAPLLEGQRRPTKREVLRVLMTIFNPLGLVSHFLSFLKILLQEIWRSGVQWDEEIDGNAYTKWQLWLQVLPRLEHVRVPRCYNSGNPPEKADDVQLHTMVDASENGMAAACYLRFSNCETIICSIVAAKSRVAPLKFTSIPRMELAAAVLGARLARTVEETLSFRIYRKVYWFDSRDVLCWINSDHRRYSPYVGHRISEIIEISEPREWRWVPSKLNCADDATKWSSLPDMSSDHRWFKRADFLWRAEENWPPIPTMSGSTDIELRPSFLAVHTLSEPVIDVSNYSNWQRLVKITALLHRFVYNCRLKHAKILIRTGPLTASELLIAERSLIRLGQREMYPDEIAALQKIQNSD